MFSQKMSEPLSGFLKLKESYKSAIIYQNLSKFSMSQIVNYFIDAVAADSNSKLDFKSLRESSFQLFKAGHIQDIYVKPGFKTLIIVATCLPEMRKDRIYKLMMRLEASSGDIQFANCGCIAGRGPKASCKHIASLCYALEEFVRIFISDSEAPTLSCTDKLMQWNQPRKRKLSPKRIDEIDFSVEKKEKRKRKCRLMSSNEPSERLKVHAVTDSDLEAIYSFRENLQRYQKKNPKQKVALLSVLGENAESSALATIQENHAFMASNAFEEKIRYKRGLQVSSTERLGIFQTTKDQHRDSKWFNARKGRITGSVCGRILNRSQTIFPKSILSSIICDKNITTAAMQMGKDKEQQILVRYKNYMQQLTGKNVTIESAGFLIHPEKGWLGASPDAVIVEANGLKGCVEVKTAVACWDKTIEDAIQSNRSFCLKKKENGLIALKENHNYYHQCQLQLYVGCDMFNFCDFVVATSNDIYVERIRKNKEWTNKNIPILEDFYDSFLLSKLVKA